MAAAAYRKKLGKPLENAQQYGVCYGHGYRFLGRFIMAEPTSTNPPITTNGASVMRLKLKSSSPVNIF